MSDGTSSSSNGGITQEEAYLERKIAADEMSAMAQRYEDKISSTRQLTEAFFDAYQRDVDNSFNLYKNQRDSYDSVLKEQHDNYDILNQKIIDSSFNLYKNQRDNLDAVTKEQHDNYDTLNQKIIETSFNIYKNGRDEKDALNEKINSLQSKVDVMAAVRPYQDALINCKIEKNALLADWHLDNRTCRMIEGQLVLPDNLVSGFTSYSTYSYN